MKLGKEIRQANMTEDAVSKGIYREHIEDKVAYGQHNEPRFSKVDRGEFSQTQIILSCKEPHCLFKTYF